MARPRALVTVIGEALIDLVPGEEPGCFLARPGGSPFNVAVGLARLGQDTALMARFAGNALGRILRERAEAERLDLRAAPDAGEPATLAVVSLDAQARASYDFYVQGTADWQWTAGETGRVPAGTALLHFGSLASWTPPGEEHIAGLAHRMHARGDVLVSYDPNIRPGLIEDHERGQRMTERSVRLAHLAKASAEDLAWLYPGREPREVAGHWLELGAAAVVVTDGAGGATAFTAAGPPVHSRAPEVNVADTIGAGDSFTAGLLASLIRRGRHTPDRLAGCPAPDLAAALDDAAAAAAVTCSRPGADPPALADLGPAWGRAARPA